MSRPDVSTTDAQLWERLLREVGRHGRVVAVRPGVVQVVLAGQGRGR